MKYEFDQMKENIPLYINGELQGEERAVFEQQLKVDQQLQQEYEEFLLINRMFEQLESNQSIDTDGVFKRIQGQIALDESKEFSKKSVVEISQSPFFEKLSAFFSMNNLGWGIAVAQFVVLAVMVTGNFQHEEDMMTTLSNESGVAIGHQQLTVVFDVNASIEQVSGLLQGINAVIIDGPSKVGMVKISLSKTPESLEKIIDDLKASPIVIFVEKSL
jgi:hypothetical protein